MKLIYFIQALYNSGGMERVLCEKMNYLVCNYDYEIIVVTVEQMGRPVFFPLNKKIKQIHIDIDFDAHYDYNLLKKYYFHKKKQKQYRKEVQKIIDINKPDICISTGGKEIEFLTNIKNCNCKIVEMHFSINMRALSMAEKNYWSLLGKIRNWQLRKQTKHLDKLVVLTDNDAQLLKRTHSNLIVIPNPSFLKPKVTEYNSESKIAVSVGRLYYQKGYDMLLQAWEKVSLMFPDWQLHIYGQGKEEENLKKIISENNLQKSVMLKGLSNDIADVYADSSFLVLSSRYEGFPLVIIEAMTCGLPVVAFDCEFGPSSIITNYKNGILVPPENINCLAEKIIELIENEQLRKKMSIAAKENSKKYELGIIMQQWDNLFSSLIK
ncbi:MAG: glycosyltransferase family 4 protein [Paludibacter sp.]|nr:glycosyltransferase family 4 protein [Paludibacter sp.]